MTAPPTLRLTSRPEWKSLVKHFDAIQSVHLRQLFSRDADRGRTMTVEGAGLYLDYSKNRITGETITLLMSLAKSVGLAERIEAMFTGEKINLTEGRAVLHTAPPITQECVRDGGRGRCDPRCPRGPG